MVKSKDLGSSFHLEGTLHFALRCHRPPLIRPAAPLYAPPPEKRGNSSVAAAAADAGAWLPVLWDGGEGHRGNEAAAGKPVLVIQRQQVRDVQPLGAMADTIAAGSAWQNNLFYHLISN